MDRGPELFFDTDPAWIEVVRTWAASDARITHVWMFGSRATGRCTPKPDPDPEPDLDIGFLIDPRPGESDTEPIAYVMSAKKAWRARLAAAIQVKIDLQHAEPATDERVWPAIEREGVLIYVRAS